jgi:hypothetical protein
MFIASHDEKRQVAGLVLSRRMLQVQDRRKSVHRLVSRYFLIREVAALSVTFTPSRCMPPSSAWLTLVRAIARPLSATFGTRKLNLLVLGNGGHA